MSSTPHLALPLLAAAQAQKHVTHNEALASLDALVHLAVKERGRTAPPAAPEDGDRFLVGTGATGAFTDQDGKIALFDLGTWRFLEPRSGWRAYVDDEGVIIVFDGEQWQDLGRSFGEIDNLNRLGLGTSADNLNRFSAKLNAALFAALAPEEGGTGDLRFVLNKGSQNSVLSQLYQRSFSGRAETGLIGNDDFSIRVSPDGTQWSDALVIDRQTGRASFPNGLSNLAGSNLLINSAFTINQRKFSGGALAANAFGFDRWKAGPGNCTLNRAADGTVTLTGPVDQVIDVAQVVAQLGWSSLAGATLTLSVEDPSGPLPVSIGSKAAIIPAGSGRCAATVTLDDSETGNVTVRLQPSSACSFKRAKLELGAYATPWKADSLEVEEFRCRRYYQRLAVTGGTPSIFASVGQRVGSNAIDFLCTLPVAMRADPTLLTSGFTWSNGSPAGNQVGFYNNSAAAWAALTGTLSVTSAAPASPAGIALRLQASTTFSGTAGTSGSLQLGNLAFLALQAEL